MADSHLTLEDRFWAKVDKSGHCWVWTGATGFGGYGRIQTPSGQRRAHRLSYEWANGPIAHGQVICHHCDNPPCVRPSHLFTGTVADNMADMREKGRGYAPPRKLTDAQADEARCLYRTGTVSKNTLAARFHTSSSVITRATKGIARRIERPRTKLTPLIVESVRARYAVGDVTQLDLVAEYGLSKSSIQRIIYGTYGIVRSVEQALALIQ